MAAAEGKKTQFSLRKNGWLGLPKKNFAAPLNVVCRVYLIMGIL